jgi:thiamine kinase-like enzyme
MANHNGLEWVWSPFGPEPRWTKVPDIAVIERLSREYLVLKANAACKVAFFAEGGFNKLYKVETITQSFIFRVALPVDPGFKTNSEVTTLRFVRQKANIPVAEVIAFDASNNNELGFEWILMEFVYGQTLREKWRKCSFRAKEDLVRSLAGFQTQLFGEAKQTIGNLYEETDSASGTAEEPTQARSFKVGRIVSPIFFSGDNLKYDIPRGPFQNSFQWFKSRTALIKNETAQRLTRIDEQAEREEAESIDYFASRIEKLVDRVLSEDANPEHTVCFHHDLSWRNILVDDDGKISAIIDWESVSMLPLWKAYELPEFLVSRDRKEEPQKEDYSADTYSDSEEDDGETKLDNEGLDEMYSEHLCDYESTILRPLYLKQINDLDMPGMPETPRKTLLVEIDMAIENCRNPFLWSLIDQWLDALETGEKFDLVRQASLARI